MNSRLFFSEELKKKGKVVLIHYHAPDDLILCFTDAEIDLLKRTLVEKMKLKGKCL